MNENQIAALKDDFLQWTGGFEPESSDQVAVYVLSSMPFDFDEREAEAELLVWMRKTYPV